MSAFLSALVAVFTALPKLFEFIQELRKHSAEVNKVKKEHTAYERLQTKRNTIRAAIDAAKSRVSDDTVILKRNTKTNGKK